MAVMSSPQVKFTLGYKHTSGQISSHYFLPRLPQDKFTWGQLPSWHFLIQTCWLQIPQHMKNIFFLFTLLKFALKRLCLKWKRFSKLRDSTIQGLVQRVGVPNVSTCMRQRELAAHFGLGTSSEEMFEDRCHSAIHIMLAKMNITVP